MELARLSSLWANGFCRFLFCYGVGLLLTPPERFSIAYRVMFDVADKDIWSWLYLLSGTIGFIALYVGSWNVYRWSILFSALAFTLLAAVFFASVGTTTGVFSFINLAFSCLLYLAGAPIYGCIYRGQRETPRLLLSLSNQPARILLGFGTGLLLTQTANPITQFMSSFAPLGIWAAAYVTIGLIGFGILYLASWRAYCCWLWVAALSFGVIAAAIGFGGGTIGGVFIFVNLLIDCLLYLAGAPIYGFVSKLKTDES